MDIFFTFLNKLPSWLQIFLSAAFVVFVLLLISLLAIIIVKLLQAIITKNVTIGKNGIKITAKGNVNDYFYNTILKFNAKLKKQEIYIFQRTVSIRLKLVNIFSKKLIEKNIITKKDLLSHKSYQRYIKTVDIVFKRVIQYLINQYIRNMNYYISNIDKFKRFKERAINDSIDRSSLFFYEEYYEEEFVSFKELIPEHEKLITTISRVFYEIFDELKDMEAAFQSSLQPEELKFLNNYLISN